MAVTTITTTGAEDSRIIVAFGDKLGLAGSATAAQVKADLITYMTNVVRTYEARVAANNAAAAVVSISPT